MGVREEACTVFERVQELEAGHAGERLHRPWPPQALCDGMATVEREGLQLRIQEPHTTLQNGQVEERVPNGAKTIQCATHPLHYVGNFCLELDHPQEGALAAASKSRDSQAGENIAQDFEGSQSDGLSGSRQELAQKSSGHGL